MMIVVYFRKDTVATSTDMENQLVHMEEELIEHNIYFQSITKRSKDAVNIMCNDAEEREHIKHLLLKH